MKKVLSLLVLVAGFGAAAARANASEARPSDSRGFCVARDGYEGHESFCNGLSSFACDAHSSICRWKRGGRRHRPRERCWARRGYEGHETFCRDLEKWACRAHRSVCEWD